LVDRPRGYIHVVVLPNAHDYPACLFQRLLISSVTLDVSQQLAAPVIAVGGRNMPMVWAPMPEAAIDKHGNSQTREGKIGSDAAGPAYPD
jgi:hypothetical protein